MKAAILCGAHAIALFVSLRAASAQDTSSSAKVEPRQDARSIEARLAEQERAIAALRAELAESGDPRRANLRTGYDDAFFIESSDGSERFTIGGLLQIDGNFFEGGLDDRDNEFELRRMRLELGGRLFDRWRFNIEPNFASDGVELEEAWIGAELIPNESLFGPAPAINGPLVMLGRMKEPFGLEEYSPRRWSDFVGFSILNQFSPAEDHGVTMLGSAAGGAIDYGAALYNGTGGDELNDDKDAALRLVWNAVRDDARRQGLQLGIAATYGDADEDVAGEELDTEARVPFLAFEPGSELDGDRTRLGAEFAWLSGPLGVQAELLHIEQSMRGAGGRTDIDFDGWYAQASWVLTGEDKTRRGVFPFHPVGTQPSSHGAVQLAARVSSLALDDNLVAAGLVAPTSDPERVTSYDAGVNWWLDRHAVFRLHFLHTDYHEDITISGDTRGSEDALLFEFQLQF